MDTQNFGGYKIISSPRFVAGHKNQIKVVAGEIIFFFIFIFFSDKIRLGIPRESYEMSTKKKKNVCCC